MKNIKVSFDTWIQLLVEQRHISLASGQLSIAFERGYWKALETLAYEDAWHNWSDFFYRNILPNKLDDMPLAS